MRLLLLAVAFCAGPALAQHSHPAPAPSTGDPHAVAETFVVTGLRLDEAAPPPGSGVGRAGLRYADGGYVAVSHGKPYARGRVVFGGLVAYDAVWAAGAHRATELATTVPLEIGGTVVPPGVYALFVTPGAEAWTLHVNARPGQHLADEYDPAEDLATVAAPAVATDLVTEGLMWSFADDGKTLRLAWADRAADFPIARADAG